MNAHASHRFALGAALFLGLALGAGGMALLPPPAPSSTAPAKGASLAQAGPPTDTGDASATPTSGKPAEAPLSKLALDMQAVEKRFCAIHTARARAMSPQQRLDYVKKRLLETDTSCWVWWQHIGPLRLELAQYILPEDIPAMLELSNSLPYSENYDEKGRLLKELTLSASLGLPEGSLLELSRNLPISISGAVKYAALEQAKARDPFAPLTLMRNEEGDPPDWSTQAAFKEAAQKDFARAFRDAGQMRSMELRVKAYAGAMLSLIDEKSKDVSVKAAWDKCGELDPAMSYHVRLALLEDLPYSVNRHEVMELLLGDSVQPALMKQGLQNLMWQTSSDNPAQDIEMLSKHLDRFKNPRELTNILGALYESMSYHSPDKGLKFAQTQEGVFRERGVQVAFGRKAEKDRAGAFAEVERLPEVDMPFARAAVVSNWAQSQPAEAAAYITSLGEVPGRPEAVGGLIQAWTRIDAAAASEWLDQEPAGLSRDHGAKALAIMVARRDPESAAAWVLQIQDSKIKSESVTSLAYSWKYANPDKARDWIQQNAAALGADESRRFLDIVNR